MRKAFGLLLLGFSAIACTTLLGDFELTDKNSTASTSVGGNSTASTSVGGNASSSSGMGGAGGVVSSSSSGGGPNCPDGYANCEPSNPDCETPVTADILNCGACGVECVTGTCQDQLCSGITKLVTASLTLHHIDVDADYVYWTTASEVRKVPLAGGQSILLASNQPGPNFISVSANYAYWSNLGQKVIRRIAKASPAAVEDVSTNQGGSLGLTTDDTYVYWGNKETMPNVLDGALHRKEHEGLLIESFASGQRTPYDIILRGQNLYWTDQDAQQVMQQDTTNLGSSPTLVANNQGVAKAIAASSTWIYWITGVTIKKKATSGMGSDQIFTVAANPIDLTADDSTVYWTDATTNEVNKIPAAGGNTVTIANMLQSPGSITIDQTHVYWAADKSIYKALK